MRLCKGDVLYITEDAYLRFLEDARSKLSKWNVKAEFHAEDGSVHKVFLKYAYYTDKIGIELLMKESKFQMYYPHIAVVYGSLNAKDAEGADAFCVLMELVEGEHLWDYRIHMKKLDEDQMFSQMLQLLYGVQYYMKYVSEDRYVHRDLKPENIMITYKDGKVVIVDFDWSHIHGSSVTMHAGECGRYIGGTTGYADPRAFFTTKTDVQMDIYSLGRIFCFWLIGDHYFTSDERAFEKYPVLGDENLYGLDMKRIPKQFHSEKYAFLVDVIIKKMVAPVKDRYADIDHVIADMELFLKNYYQDDQAVSKLLGNEHMLINDQKVDHKRDLMVRVQFEKAQTVQTYLIENYSVRDIKYENRLLMSIYNVNSKLNYMIYDSRLVKDKDQDLFYLDDERIKIQYM